MEQGDQPASNSPVPLEPREPRAWPIYLSVILGVVVVLSLGGVGWSVFAERDRPEDAGNSVSLGPGVVGAASPAGPEAASVSPSVDTRNGAASLRPSTSRSASRAPSASATPAGSVQPLLTPTMTATYTLNRVWGAQFESRLTMQNRSGTAQSWKAVLVFPAGVGLYLGGWIAGGPGGFVVSHVGQTYTFVGDTKIGPGATTVLEFQFAKIGLDRSDFYPTSCSVNGARCIEQ